ncbi:MAG: TIR domain-containing protein [Pyrinomonadaceae bacterium]
MEESTTNPYVLPGIAFHPKKNILATLGEDDGVIRIWELDADLLLGSEPQVESGQYTNAKVVLVGDSGVGKSGLGLVLSGQEFEPTESTHGRRVWMFDKQEVGLDGGRRESRETLLWDLAGQPGYRVFHRQHLNDVAVALVLFDSRSETDPFAGVAYWARSLDEVAGRFPLVKFLVAARADRGGPSVSDERIAEVCRRYGFRGFFETSARSGAGVAELADAVRGSVAWDKLPRVITTLVFHEMKSLVVAEKEAGRTIQRRGELLGRFPRDSGGAAPDVAAFRTCLELVESAGLIKSLDFGDLVLLQPEMLDDYGAWMAQAARREPDGLGFISDRRAREGDFAMDAGRALRETPEERLLITATVEDIVRRGIALRQPTEKGEMLIFPSELRTDIPDYPGGYVRAVTFTFEGPVKAIYATLAVCLAHAPAFNKETFFRNAALFRSPSDEVCGFAMDYPDRFNDALGQLTVFFDELTSRPTKLTFMRYVNRQLEELAFKESVRRERVYYCNCGYPEPVPQKSVEWRRESGKSTVICNGCGREFPIDDYAEQSARADSDVDRQMALSDEERARQGRLTVLGERERRGEFHVFLCHNSKDKPEVRLLAKKLREQGLLPWLDDEGIPAGERFLPALEEMIDNVPAAAVVVGPHSLGRWQEQEYFSFLQRAVEHRTGAGKRPLRLIPVLLPGAPDVAELSLFLRGWSMVDFRVAGGLEAGEPLRRLVRAVTGTAAEG